MNTTHSRRIWRQSLNLWKRNWTVLLLAWGLAGSISYVASDPTCAKIELGFFGTLLNHFILRTTTLSWIVGLGLFYLAIGLILYFTGKRLRFREIQRRFFQPIFAPALFVVAGYFLGLPAPLMNQAIYVLTVVMAVIFLVLATIVSSIYEVMEIGNVKSTASERGLDA